MAKQKPLKWHEKVNQKLNLWADSLKKKTLVPLESWLKSKAEQFKDLPQKEWHGYPHPGDHHHRCLRF